MISRDELAALIGRINASVVEQVFVSVPYATHLTGDDSMMDVQYYLRHRIETVKRIQLTAKTDAMALVQMIELDYDSARPWSEYVAEELDHDRLYLRDLARHGVSAQQVEAVAAFPSTHRMVQYITEQLDVTGPLAAVAYSLFTEWNSARGSATVVQKAERQFSTDHVVGSKAHIGIDNDEDHYEVMVGIAHRLISRKGTVDDLERLLRAYGDFFGTYFDELYHATVGLSKRSEDSLPVPLGV